MDRQALDGFLRRVGLGHHGDRKAELGSFFQPFLTARRWPHFAGQPDFAERNEAARQRLAAVGESS